MTDEAEDDREREVQLALVDYLRRIDAGEIVDRGAFLHEHAAVATALAELLATADRVQEMAGPVTQRSEALEAVENDGPSEESLPATVEFRAQAPGTGSRDDVDASQPSLQKFGDYELLEVLGRGGMGVVYKAIQTSIGRTVAVKMIRAGRLATETDITRFYREAQAAGRLGHARIVDIYDAGEVEGHHFFSMEYVEGTTLAQILRSGPLSVDRVVHYLKPVAEAIDYAHENGVLHRDLKPSNILIDLEDLPKVTDFGLAKDITEDEAITESGSALGTPSYMSPEQAEARRDLVGLTTDVYALGVILYEMLTGRSPFRGASVIETILQVIHDEPIPPATVNKECNRDLEAVCLKCLRKDPRERYTTAQEFADELDRVSAGQPVQARRISPARRTWYWLRDVPLLAAAIGRKAAKPTAWHVRLQWAVLIAVMMVVGAALVVPAVVGYLRLRVVDIGAGPEGGTYDEVADGLAIVLPAPVDVRVVETEGTVESLEQLQRGEVDLAIAQQNALASHPEALILAPLYDEIVLVLIRRESGIVTIADLAGHDVALGKKGSGMRLTSEAVLSAYRVLDDVVPSSASFTAIVEDHGPEAAIVTAKLDDRRLQAVLASGKVRAIPVTRHVPLLSEHVEEEDPDKPWLPLGGLRTLQTRAVLAVRSDAPGWFVRDCLEALYFESDITRRRGFFPLTSTWHDLHLHEAAREFFEKESR